MKKILLVCNDSNTVINFRRDLILFLASKNFEIHLVVGDKKRINDINKLPLTTHVLEFENRSLNVFKNNKFKKSLKSLIKQIGPDIVFNFQIKPNVFGSICAYKCGVKKIYCMVEGLGNPFMPRNFLQKIVRRIVIKLYKNAVKRSTKFFFINKNDLDLFKRYKIINDLKSVLINGIGVDTKKIKQRKSIPPQKKVVYLSRLIRNKGIMEYCEIASIVKGIQKDIEFDLYGEPGDIDFSALSKYIDNGIINYLGYTNTPVDVIKESRILCSTSYREGIPKIILEAMALGIPVVASNVIGNRDIVVDGKTGYLVNLTDSQKFADTIINLINDENIIRKLGNNARKECESKYDSKEINSIILSVITESL